MTIPAQPAQGSPGPPSPQAGQAPKKQPSWLMNWWNERKKFLIVTTLLYGFFAIIFLLLGDKKTRLPFIDLDVVWRLVWLVIVLVYTFSPYPIGSIVGTGKSERALKFFLGYWPHQEIPPQRVGFMPPLVYRLETVVVTIQQTELPGEPEQIWRFKDDQGNELPLGIGSDGNPLPPIKKTIRGEEVKMNWVQPIRTAFNDDDPTEEKDPLKQIGGLPEMPEFIHIPHYLMDEKGKVVKEGKGKDRRPVPTEDPANKRVITEVSGTLQWRVWGAANFWRSYGDFANAMRILTDIAVTEMTSALQTGTLARAYANQGLLGHYITMKIRERVDHHVVYRIRDDTGKVTSEIPRHPKGDTISCRRGIEIIQFQLKPPGLSHDLARAIQQILEEKARAVAAKRQAEGEKARMELLERFAGTPGGQMMVLLEQLETIKTAIGPTDKVILADSQDPTGKLFGAIPAARALWEAGGKNQTPTQPLPPQPPKRKRGRKGRGGSPPAQPSKNP